MSTDRAMRPLVKAVSLTWAMGLTLFVLALLFPVRCPAQEDTFDGRLDPSLETFLRERIVEASVDLQLNDATSAYLRRLGPGRLRLVRNAIFAARGYVFRDSALQAYFEDRSWYEPEDRAVSLSATENKDVKYVQSLEKRVRSRFEMVFEKFPPCGGDTIRVQFVRDDDVSAAGYQQGVMSQEEPLRKPGIPGVESNVYLRLDRARAIFGTEFGVTRPGCTLEVTDQYRAVVYFVDTAAGGGTTTCYLATFGALDNPLMAGARLSRRSILSFGAGNSGKATITLGERVLIKAKQVERESRYLLDERRTTKIVKRWRWHVIRPNGEIVRLRGQKSP
ncbi:MAG: YARHG domain-containing protein [Salinibacter sp.]|uniref:YARHG domain-containing protein n=1 Tax=Salinibacter sp. TaxID=2065818 RepID=UPI0035D49269